MAGTLIVDDPLVKRVGLAICVALAIAIALPAAPVRAAALVVGDYARVTVHRVELRSGAGLTYSAQYKVDKGEIVKLTGGPSGCLTTNPCVGGWYRVTHHGKTGYLPQDALAYTGLAGRTIAQRYTRVIVVALARQQVEVYSGGKLVYITPTTTGKPATPTPIGTFKVSQKKSPYVFRSPYPEGHPEWYAPSPVEMVMRFYRDYYLHDAPWRPAGGYGFGTNESHVDPDGRVREGSHGCVNLPLAATRWLWNWVRLDDVVRVVNS